MRYVGPKWSLRGVSWVGGNVSLMSLRCSVRPNFATFWLNALNIIFKYLILAYISMSGSHQVFSSFKRKWLHFFNWTVRAIFGT